jgi:molecular chaperone DnaK
MISDAEQHASEDRRRREEIEARNELDSLAYRAEQLIEELGDGVPVHEKARAEQLVVDARRAIEDEAALDRVRPLAADLQQAIHSLQSAASSATGTGNGEADAAAGGNGERPAAEEEEVVDAEFTRE